MILVESRLPAHLHTHRAEGKLNWKLLYCRSRLSASLCMYPPSVSRVLGGEVAGMLRAASPVQINFCLSHHPAVLGLLQGLSVYLLLINHLERRLCHCRSKKVYGRLCHCRSNKDYAIFKVADKDNSGTLTKEEFKDVIEDIIIRYPQVELYLQKKHLSDVYDLLKNEDENNKKGVDIEGFKLAPSHIDKQMKSLPATAQVAAEQGAYLARCFNMRERCTFEPEGPQKFRSGGRHEFLPFRSLLMNVQHLVRHT
ncbi:hypothetical protein ACS0TY_015765 [Phlomoides rotata]